MLEIKNLKVLAEDQVILQNIHLNIKAGEVHAIMGPNGSGKSTLAKVVAGHPDYAVEEGEITYMVNLKKKNLLELAPDERAKEGIFLGFQYPIEIPGVNNATFLRAAFNEICRHQGVEELDPLDFDDLLKKKRALLEIPSFFIDREVNVDLSGGEKKRNEILQMAVLNPRLAFLDETDSGLDVDSLKIVGEGIRKLKTEQNAFVLVTHYKRLLSYVKPDYVHIISHGSIVKTGGLELVDEIEERGYGRYLPKEERQAHL